MILYTYMGTALCPPKNDWALGTNGGETGKLTYGKSLVSGLPWWHSG